MQIKKAIVDTARYLAIKNWAEAGSGNISYLCDIELTDDCKTMDLGFEAKPGLKCFITRSGSMFRKLVKKDVGIVNVLPDGRTIRHSFDDGLPTSEISTHLLCLSELSDTENKLIVHAHLTYLVALTKKIKDEKALNDAINCITEIPLIIPDGVGLVPLTKPGSVAIGQLTAQKVRDGKKAIAWDSHGLVAIGRSLDEAVNIIEAVEKASQIYLVSR